MGTDPLRALGLYYIASGAWALVDLRSFMWVTGPKRDTWLVQTFGALVAAMGAVLLLPRSEAGTRELRGMMSAVAVTIAACEVFFVARGRIRPVYLADALVEVLFVAAMINASRPSATKRGRTA